jgi:hypothetical protein
MKLIFTFSLGKPSDRYTTTAIDLPDEAAQLPDAKDRILAIAHAVSSLTRANLSVTCLPLDLKSVRIKQAELDSKTQQEISDLITAVAETILVFNYKGREQAVRKLRIAAPITPPVLKNDKDRSLRPAAGAKIKRSGAFKDSLHRPAFAALDKYEAKQQAYYAHFAPLVENTLVLLNAHPTFNEWRFEGLSPRWYDEVQQKQAAKRQKETTQKVTKEATRDARRQALDEKRTIRRKIADEAHQPDKDSDLS